MNFVEAKYYVDAAHVEWQGVYYVEDSSTVFVCRTNFSDDEFFHARVVFHGMIRPDISCCFSQEIVDGFHSYVH